MLKQQLVRLGALLMPLALSVFPLAASAQTLLSQGKPVVASPQEGAGLARTRGVEGNAGTRWGSVFADPQWIMVDLGSAATINRVLLNWETAHGKAYQIQVSDNGTSWTTIYSTINSDGGIDDLALNGSGRYLRMYGTVRANGYGYSLWELQVYGSQGGGTGSSAAISSSASSRSSAVVISSSKTTSSSTTMSSSLSISSKSSSLISSSRSSSLTSSSSISSSDNDSSSVNFGSNVTIFDPAMPQAQIQARINEIYERQRDNQFGTPRDAIMFKPGTYQVEIPVGFFTHVIGLGAMPDDVNILGQVVSYPVLPNNNSTQNFWRGIENFSVTPPGAGMLWSVSQAAPMRRMHVRNSNLILHYYGGWASGGWLADPKWITT